MPATGDEFAEFDTDEATFDAMMAEAEPVELVEPPSGAPMIIRQAGRTVIEVAVPASGFLTVDTSDASSSGERLTATPGRLGVHHRSAMPQEAPAS